MKPHRPRGPRLPILCLALLVVAAGCPARPPDPPSERPNIVLVIGDDHGWPYFGFMGDPLVKTPHLDRLAAGGTVFTTAYLTASVCNPSLESLLTGELPFGRGRPSGTKRREPFETRTLPAHLAKVGYASFQAGKFWPASFEKASFTEGTKEARSGTSSIEDWMGGSAGLEVGRTTMEPVFDFIDRHRDVPFFIWFAPKLPHRPWDAPGRYRRLYRTGRHEIDPAVARYYANISWFDDSLGALVAYLDEADLTSKTLIVYLSDNGYGPRPDQAPAGRGWNGAKGTTSELGFRTPMIFNWPAHVPSGVVHENPVSALDLFPTLLTYAQAPIPEDRPGRNLLPQIEGGAAARDEVIGFIHQVMVLDPRKPGPSKKTDAFFVRDARWHYVWAPSLDTELLFDIEADPREQHDRIDDFPEVARRLRSRIEQWQRADG